VWFELIELFVVVFELVVVIVVVVIDIVVEVEEKSEKVNLIVAIVQQLNHLIYVYVNDCVCLC